MDFQSRILSSFFFPLQLAGTRCQREEDQEGQPPGVELTAVVGTGGDQDDDIEDKDGVGDGDDNYDGDNDRRQLCFLPGNSYTSYSNSSGQPAGYSYSNANGSSYYNNGEH